MLEGSAGHHQSNVIQPGGNNSASMNGTSMRNVFLSPSKMHNQNSNQNNDNHIHGSSASFMTPLNYTNTQPGPSPAPSSLPFQIHPQGSPNTNIIPDINNNNN